MASFTFLTEYDQTILSLVARNQKTSVLTVFDRGVELLGPVRDGAVRKSC